MTEINKILAMMLREQARWIETGMHAQACAIEQCIVKIREMDRKAPANGDLMKAIDQLSRG